MRVEQERAAADDRERTERERLEKEEKARKEEEEREARRKRVEAIMKRTRQQQGSRDDANSGGVCP